MRVKPEGSTIHVFLLKSGCSVKQALYRCAMIQYGFQKSKIRLTIQREIKLSFDVLAFGFNFTRVLLINDFLT